MNFSDCKVLAGDPSMLLTSSLSASVFAEDGVTKTRSVNHADDGFVPRIYYFIDDNPFGKSFVDSLVRGKRYLLIGRWEPRKPIRSHMIGDQDTMNFCSSVISLDGKPENYLDTPEFAPVRELIQITNDDLKTFDMVYTSDMRSIPRFSQQKSVMVDGRALSPEDTGSCVVSQSFLKYYNLKIGDTITVGLCSKLLEQNSVLGAIAYTPDRYSEPVKQVELTIVGTYTDNDGIEERLATAYWSYSDRTIFLPLSLLPVDVSKDHAFKPGEYSFVIGDSSNIESFLLDAQPLADKFGLKLHFDDGGWLKVSDNINTGRIMSMLTAFLFISAAGAALLLAVYVFIGQNKKIYAIMRALGTPRRKIHFSLMLPFAFLIILAIPLGGIIGSIFTAHSVTPVLESIAAMTPGYVPHIAMPTTSIVICLIGEIVLLLMFSALFLRKHAKTSPLELMQGEAVKVHVNKNMDDTRDSKIIMISKPSLVSELNIPKHDKYGAVRHVTMYIFKHIRRTIWKSVLLILLAALMCGAMGALTLARTSYSKMEIKGFLSYGASDAVQDAANSPLLKDVYYWDKLDGADFAFGQIPCAVYVTNDFERCMADSGIEKYSINYIDGYDARSTIGSPQFIISSELAQLFDLKLGDDYLLLSNEDMLQRYKDGQIGWFELYNYSSISFKIIGIVDAPGLGVAVFSRAYRGLENVFIGKYTIKNCEFIVADNEKLKQTQEFISQIETRSQRIAYYAKSSLDKAELENITQMMNLLKATTPIAVVAAILIGLFASGLSIIRSSKEAAILRVLGTTKKRTRCMLSFEQILLCVIGIIIAVLALAIYNIGLFILSTEMLSLCIGLYFLGYLCAVILASSFVTKSKVLELVQVKE